MPADRLAAARDFQRKAQFFLDFIEAENSMGFHADQEAVRILGESIDFSRKGQAAVRGRVSTWAASPTPAPQTAPAGPAAPGAPRASAGAGR